MTSSIASGSARRWEIGLALGNLLPAAVLGGGCYMLPLRWWGLDVPVCLMVAALVVTSLIALGRPALALRALQIAASALLAVGASLLAAFVLCLAFLSGVHGAFGNLGAVLMTLVVLLVAPYSVLYPACELVILHRLRRATEPAPNVPVNGTPLGAEAEQA